LTILTQPASQIAAIDRPATFKAFAVGEGTLTYQWSKNGTPIPGATSSTYTFPNVSLSDSGTTFQVTVTDQNGSLTSQSATLTAGARAPAIGDLRYLLWQQVDVPGFSQSPVQAGDVGAGSVKVPDAVGTPLGLGSDVCAPHTACTWSWSAAMLPPPMTGLTMRYKAGNLSDLNAELQSISGPNEVITSLALEPGYGQYGISWVQADQFTGFDYNLQITPLSQMQAVAAVDGEEGRVITAVAFDGSGNANLISYGWKGGQRTYEVKTMTVPATGIIAAATDLANAGYFISAFGGDDTIGWVLVGTRVKGDTLPRAIVVSTSSSTTNPSHPDNAHYTPVIRLGEPSIGFIGIAEQ